MSMDSTSSPPVYCLDPSHSPLTCGRCTCASQPHCDSAHSSRPNFWPPDPLPVQSSARLFGSQSDVYYPWPALSHSSHGPLTSGTPPMAGIGSPNGVINAGRVPSSQSAMQMDEHTPNGDIPPFDLVPYGREVVGTHSSSSSLSGQPMPHFIESSSTTNASIVVQGHGQQVHGVLHQEQILPAHMTNTELPIQMPIPLATQARVACLWPECEEDFLPILNSVVAHFRTHSTAGNKQCLWPGCVSTLKDLSQHVLDSHCDLRWICPQCFRSDFEAKRSMTRHLRVSCKGRSVDAVAICAHCGSCWKNQADMARHAPYCAHAWSSNANT